jgi:LmbE family N-acetylglucosaminyl deacetylase
VKALCLVAHPDDCIIFAYSYIHAHPEHTWSIGYLTYTAQDPRAAEMSAFWQRRNISTVFLGFEDHWHDNEQKRFTCWDPEHARQACWNLASKYDLVLTHDEHGDYGHIHHQLVHQAVQSHPCLITFAPRELGTQYILPADAYSLDELPLHKNIVAGFHQQSHCNNYKELK